MAGREERKMRYNETIRNRYQHLPEINRIKKDKKLPNRIKKANSIQHIQTVSQHRKFENKKRHTKDGDLHIEPERKRVVVKEVE